MGFKIAYFLIFYPVSLLPHRVLYFFSDIMSFVVQHIIGYRKEVVVKNLRSSFPEISDQKIKEYTNRYYHHLCDLIVESIKNISITNEELLKRFSFENVELLNELYESNKSIVMMGGHYGSWERYALAISICSQHKQLAIYKPFKNKFLNQKIKVIRERFGVQMISMMMTKKYFLKDPEDLKCITFGLDQWTPSPKKAYWSKFLQQDTSFYQSAEILAKEFDWAVVYCGLDKYKRGHYRGTFELLSDKAPTTSDGELTEAFIKRLEANIERDPPYWLWSHRRWKKTKEEVFS